MKETRHIKYTDGYKNILEEDAMFYTGITLDKDFVTEKVIHFKYGFMLIRAGFGSDGCSGPTIDDRTNIRGGTAHDGGYYLLRHGFPSKYKVVFDQMLKRLIEEDAEFVYKNKNFARIRKWFFKKVRSNYYRIAVEKFGDSAADPKNKRKVLLAP